ncbi:MAG TPA: branched-chain amino acid ABC transporter permease [Thermodesulfobacteriota bacterium]
MTTAVARAALPSIILACAVAPLPFVLGGYALSLLIVIGLHAIAVLGLSILMGQVGQVSLAQGAFYGLGAYGSAILALHGGLTPLVSMPAAVALAAVVALALGLPAVRLGGHHLALATLGFGIIVFLVFNEEGDWTGGPSGTLGIPPVAILDATLATDRAYAYLVWAVLLTALAAARALLASPVGRAFRAVAASEVAAAAMGIDVARTKLVAFVLAGALGAAAGALYAHWLTFVSPTAFGFETSIEFLVMAVLGGLGSLYGALLGAAAVTLLVEGLRSVVHAVAPGATGWVEIVAFGLILIVVLLAVPEGLAGGVARLVKAVRRG